MNIELFESPASLEINSRYTSEWGRYLIRHTYIRKIQFESITAKQFTEFSDILRMTNIEDVDFSDIETDKKNMFEYLEYYHDYGTWPDINEFRYNCNCILEQNKIKNRKWENRKDCILFRKIYRKLSANFPIQ